MVMTSFTGRIGVIGLQLSICGCNTDLSTMGKYGFLLKKMDITIVGNWISITYLLNKHYDIEN